MFLQYISSKNCHRDTFANIFQIRGCTGWILTPKLSMNSHCIQRRGTCKSLWNWVSQMSGCIWFQFQYILCYYDVEKKSYLSHHIVRCNLIYVSLCWVSMLYSCTCDLVWLYPVWNVLLLYDVLWYRFYLIISMSCVSMSGLCPYVYCWYPTHWPIWACFVLLTLYIDICAGWIPWHTIYAPHIPLWNEQINLNKITLTNSHEHYWLLPNRQTIN